MYCKNCGEAMNENQAICLKCGVEKGKGNAFCENCGKEVNPEAVYCLNCGVALKNKSANASTNNASDIEIDVENIKRRSIVVSIILSIITCGIYDYFWIAFLTNDTNKALKKENEMSGLVVALLTFITCGIFGYYWAYKMGEKVDLLSGKENGNTRWIFLGITLGTLALSLLGFPGLTGIAFYVVYAMSQNALNKAIDENA